MAYLSLLMRMWLWIRCQCLSHRNGIGWTCAVEYCWKYQLYSRTCRTASVAAAISYYPRWRRTRSHSILQYWMCRIVTPPPAKNSSQQSRQWIITFNCSCTQLHCNDPRAVHLPYCRSNQNIASDSINVLNIEWQLSCNYTPLLSSNRRCSFLLPEQTCFPHFATNIELMSHGWHSKTVPS